MGVSDAVGMKDASAEGDTGILEHDYQSPERVDQ
jgi:hypothetical protein